MPVLRFRYCRQRCTCVILAKMAKVVLLVFFTLCSTRGSHVAAAASTQLTCKPGDTTANEINGVGTFEAVCPAGTTMSPPPPPESGEGAVFRTLEKENDCDSITQVVPGACFRRKDNRNIVVISQLPNKTTTFYIHCQKDGSVLESDTAKKENCVIAVKVAASPPLGPNTCSVGGSSIPLAIENKGETAVFLCGEGRALRPVDIAQKAFNENCTDEVKLPDKVEVTPVDQAYRVTVPELPKKKTTMCYVCEKNASEKSASDKCFVTISIAASNASGALAVGVAARATAAVGLAVAVLRPWWL